MPLDSGCVSRSLPPAARPSLSKTNGKAVARARDQNCSNSQKNKVPLVAASAIMPTIEADNGHRGSLCRMLADWCRLVLGGMLQNDGLFGQNAADLVQAYS